jgi:predicted nuclease with TOPRIM domain
MQRENSLMNEQNNSITITVAATELGIPLPRLQRLLKRPEFADQTECIRHQTRTGIRMVTCVSLATVQNIRKYLYEKKVVVNKERKRTANPPHQDNQTTALLEALTQEMRGRIEEQSTIIADLRQDKNEWQEEQKRLNETMLSLQFQLSELKGQMAVLQDAQSVLKPLRQGFWERLRPTAKRK